MATTVQYYITLISNGNNEQPALITNGSTILSKTGRFIITPVISKDSDLQNNKTEHLLIIGNNTESPDEYLMDSNDFRLLGLAPGEESVSCEYCYENQAYDTINENEIIGKGFGSFTIRTTIGNEPPTYLNFNLKSQFTNVTPYEPRLIDRNTGKDIVNGIEFENPVLIQFESQLPIDLELFKVEINGRKLPSSAYDFTGLKQEITDTGSYEISFHIRGKNGSMVNKIITSTFLIRESKLNWHNARNIPSVILTDIGINCNRVIKDGVEYFTPDSNYYGTDLPIVEVDWELPPKVRSEYTLLYYENVISPSSKSNSKSQIVGGFEKGVTLLNKVGLYELNVTLVEEGLKNTFKMPTVTFVIMPNGITLDEKGLKCSINGMVGIDNTNKYFMKNDTVIPDVYYSHYIDGSKAVDVSDRIAITYSLTKDGEKYPYQNGFTQLTEVGKYVLTATVKEIFNDGDISNDITKSFEFEIKEIPLQLNSILKDLILRDYDTNEVVENKTYNKEKIKLKAPKTVENIPISMYVQGPRYNTNIAINDNVCELNEEGSYNIELKIVDPNYEKNSISKYYEIILYNPNNHQKENICPLNVYVNGILQDMPIGTDNWELPLQELNILGPCNIVAVNAFALNDAVNPENFKYSLSERTFEIVNREYLEKPFIYTSKDTNSKWSSTDLFVEYPKTTILEYCTLEIYKNDDTSPCLVKAGSELTKAYKLEDNTNTVKLTLPGEILNGVNQNGFSLEKDDTIKVVAYYKTNLLSETLNTDKTLVKSIKILENYTPYNPGEIIITGFNRANNIYYTVIPDVMKLKDCKYKATITSKTLGLNNEEIELGKELFSNTNISKPPINTGKFDMTLTVTVSYTDSLGKTVEKSAKRIFYIDRDLPLNVNFLDEYITKQIYFKNSKIIKDLKDKEYNFNINELRVFLNNRRVYPENNMDIDKNNPLGAFKYLFNPHDGNPGLPTGGYNLMITFENENNGKVISYQKWFNVVSTPLDSRQKKPLIPLRGTINEEGVYSYNITPENEELVQITNSEGETTGQVAVYKEGLTINKMSELQDSVDYFHKEVSLLQSDIALNESKSNAIKPIAVDIRDEIKSSLIRKSTNAEIFIKEHYEKCDKITLADVSELVNTKIESHQQINMIRTNEINLNLLMKKISGHATSILKTIENYQNLASATAEVMYTYNNNLVTEKNEEILPSGMTVDIYDRIKAFDANGNTNFFTIVPGSVITAKAANKTTWLVYDRNGHEIAKQDLSTEFTFTVTESLEDNVIKIKAIDLADPNGVGKYKLLSLKMTY